MGTAAGRGFFSDRCFGPREGWTYGPVVLSDESRSLGVCFSPPDGRLCSFDCAYCPVAGGRPPRAHWPTPGEIASHIANAAHRLAPIDSLTICGRGEPTLHPHFVAAVGAVRSEALRLRPRARVRIVTNGARVVRPEVRRALDELDERIVRIDAAPSRINRPRQSFRPGTLAASLARLRDVTVHSCFVGGALSNAGERDVAEWAELVARLRPRRVGIYTIDAAVDGAGAHPLEADRLAGIALALRRLTGLAPVILG